VFTASVTVKPEVELGEYKGVEVEKVEVNVTDEDVEKELKAVAERTPESCLWKTGAYKKAI